MIIRKQSPISGRVHEADLPITDLQLSRWRGGEFIQDVMPHLSASEREFLISGIPPHEWDDVFGDDEPERSTT